MVQEIILSGEYKDFKLDKHFVLDGASNQDALNILATLSENIDKKAFEFAGVNLKVVDDFVTSLNLKSSMGFGISGLTTPLNNMKQSDLKKVLLKACNDNKLLIPAAESYFIHSLLTKFKIPFKFNPTDFKSNLKPKSAKMPGRIVFVGNYNKWMAIKKLKLEKVKDYEVSAILSSINFTIINKMFELSNVEDEATVAKLTKGKRKSLKAFLEVLLSVESLEKDPKKLTYLVCKVCEKLKYRPFASPHMLMKAYPDVKPPKVRGRKPK